MSMLGWVLPAAAVIAALMFVPDGIILDEALNGYYIGERADVPLGIQPYGLTIAAGTVCAAALFLLIFLAGKKNTQSQREYIGKAIAFPAGAVCFGFVLSRLLYCLVSIIFYCREGAGTAILRFWEGGMSMTGALLGITLSGILTLRKDEKAWEAAVPATALAIAAARLAEHFGNMGYGREVEFENLFSVTDEYCSMLNVWLIELAAVVLIAAALTAWRKMDTRCPRGMGFAGAFAAVYGTVQILMESLRMDRHMVWGFVKSQQLFSFLIAMFVLLLFSRHSFRDAAIVFGVSCALAGSVFGLEKALDRLDIADIWIYLVFGAVIAGYLVFAVYVMRKKISRRAADS